MASESMNLLSVRDLTQSYTEEPLYKGISFGVDEAEKVAVVGPNGSGKTTLFRILMGQVEPDSGEIALRQDATIAFLAQEVSFIGTETPREVVSRAVARLEATIKEHEALTASISEGTSAEEIERLLFEQDELQQQIEKLGGWDWERRVEEMLDRLGLTSLLDAPVGSLSGGQQRRVDLARVLLEAPDLLLLDEPTNHLDPDTVDWLEGWLKKRVRGLLLITHDRYFLERVVDRILEVSRDSFYDCPGDYRTFMERKLARMEVTQRTHGRERRLIQDEISKIKARSGGTAQVRELEARKARLEQEEDHDALMRMKLARGNELGPLILAAHGVSKKLGSKVLLESTGMGVRTGDKIGLVGPNGCGKTTLLQILMSIIRPDAGIIEVGDRTDIAYLRQHGPPIDEDTTVYEAIGPSDYVWVGDTRHHKRRFLEQFLFDSELQKRPARLLSGGQKRRLQLARVVAQNANMLILDEPTNDLDILSLQALEVALEDFQGCVIVVSHDRYFLNRTCNVIIAIEDRKLVRYDGNYSFYRKRKDREIEREREARSAERSRVKRARHERAERERASRSISAKERRELEELEARIQQLEEEAANVRAQLADPALYEGSGSGEAIEALGVKLAALEREQEERFEAWMELEAKR